MQFSRFIFILIDGAPYSVFHELIENNELPNIKRFIINQGCLKKAVSVFPSTTGPAFIPFFMGLFPGTANVPGYRWLSKKDILQHKYGRPGLCSYQGADGLNFLVDLPDQPTLFNYFSPVSNIYNLLTKGCSPVDDRTRRKKPLAYAAAHFFHKIWQHITTVASQELIKAVEEGDQFISCLFSAVDGHSHFSHTKSKAVIKSYKSVDQTIGKVCQSLYRSGDLDKTMILISSDHGMTNTKTHIDIARCLDRSGHRCLHYPLIWRRNVKSASMVSGNGMANLYFKANAVDWGERMSFEEIDRRGVVDFLLEFEGLGLIAGQSEDGSIIVRNRLGKGQVSAVNGTISYKFDGVDPLGYNTCYQNLSSREALIETYDTKYPDGLVQISQIFRSSRAGDLVLSAEPGYDLRARYEYPEHHATHGGLIAGQMLIPLAVNFPIETEFIRSVDIFPTVLNQFGHQVEGFEIDGQIVK